MLNKILIQLKSRSVYICDVTVLQHKQIVQQRFNYHIIIYNLQYHTNLVIDTDLQSQNIYTFINQLRTNMEKQSGDVSAKVLLEIKDVPMHRFINNKKTVFTQGTCKIAKIDHNNGSTVYFINMNSFYYTLRKQIVFVKLVYEQSVSYLFPHFENGLSTISLPKDSPSIFNLQQILSNAAVLVDYKTAMNDPSVRNKIETHCKNIINEPVYNPDVIKQTIANTGKLLGVAFTAIGGFVKTGVNKAGQFIHGKVDQGENGQVNPQTRQKWESLKKGTSDMLQVSLGAYNQYIDPLVKPVYDKGMQNYNSLKQKIETSNNQNVIYARQLAQTSGKALGQAFDDLVKTGKQVGDEFGTQTRKIVHKKYGDDYVKTFIDNEGHQGYEKLSSEQAKNPTHEKIDYPDLDDPSKK